MQVYVLERKTESKRVESEKSKKIMKKLQRLAMAMLFKLWRKLDGAITAYLLLLSSIGTGAAPSSALVAGEASKIVSITVGLLVAGILIPVALSSIYNATLPSGTPDAVKIVFTLLMPVLAVVAIALLFFRGITRK